MSSSQSDLSLSSEASRSTAASLARTVGGLALLALVLATAGHAVLITMGYARLSVEQNLISTVLALLGVVLVEVFATITGVRFFTHSIRAKQKPIGMLIEGFWVLFASFNLISSFAFLHGEGIPSFVNYWVSFGLPIAGLIMGVLYYTMDRLDPEASRAEDNAELSELLVDQRHKAKVEVMKSPQMNLVIRQAVWHTLPEEIGRSMNLTERQIASLRQMAPELLQVSGPVTEALPETTASRNTRAVAERGATRSTTEVTLPIPEVGETEGDGDSGEQRNLSRRQRRLLARTNNAA